MTGVHKQVGQIRRPDKELTINVIHAMDKILEAEWENTIIAVQKKRITEMGAWFIGGFCTGFHGEEIFLNKLAGTANSLVHLNDKKDAHFIFAILGRTTKANQKSAAKFTIPCAPVIQGTHLRLGHWVKHLMILHVLGRRTGWFIF
jgi:hypothetical protein